METRERRPPSSGVNVACARFIAAELEKDDTEERDAHVRARETAKHARQRHERAIKKKVRWGEQASSHDIDDGRYEPARLELEQAFVDWLESSGAADSDVLWSGPLAVEEDMERFHDDLLEFIRDDDSVCTVMGIEVEQPKSAATGDASVDESFKESRRRRSSFEFHSWLASIADLRSESDSTAPLM